MTDQEILEWYMKGFNDELKGTTSTVPEGIASKAYGLGANHAEIGDDVRSVDYLSNEEILKLIRSSL